MKKADRVAIVLHGEFNKPDDLWAWTGEADMVIATDGAADTLLTLGIKPGIVIGDMDGIRNDTLASLPEDAIVKSDDQDSTDFQKALDYATDALQAKNVAVLAYEGSRVDHMLSSLFTPAPYADTMSIRFVGREAQVLVMGKGTHEFPAKAGLRISLLPLGAVTIETATGLTYPIDGLTLFVGGRDGISNEATHDAVTLEISSGALLAFVQRFDGEPRW